MKKHHLYPGYLLNRIAANHSGNPAKADPIQVLKVFFDYAGRAEQIKAFDDFAALH
ncbi:hypothetical protein U0035_14300 [Niabella yanshanensis]|uniref:Uncharacterized protein n=1 Tax=Niabella yanshanensis TaxID=577386 RepID=A0ABZ0W433_9BACT|nr:hypothetical protein [Niabella yanshanensis]WQD36840.1 hypothetical protein U0035_14300 [Niabella yanshanensis]